MYTSESEAWHWKMTDWNLWSRPLSVQTWGASSADGWSYYTWPFFWSHSLKEWCYTASDYGNAFVVNLGSGEWTIFGKTDKGVPSEEETAVVEETTVEVTTNADTTTEETEGFAPIAFGSVGSVMYVDDPEDGDSIAIIRNDDKYIQFAEDLSWVDIGAYIYTKSGPDTAIITTTYSGLDSSDDTALYPYPEEISDLTFSSNDSFTSIDREDKGDSDPIVVSQVSIIGPQEFAPASLVGYTSTSKNYENETSTVFFSSATSATVNDSIDGSIPITYTYRKVGPREGLVKGSFASSSGVVDLNFTIFFISENSGYYYSTSEDTGYPISYSWGTFSVSDK